MKKILLMLLMISLYPCHAMMLAFNVLQKVAGPTIRVKINTYMQEKTKEFVLQNTESNNNNVPLQQEVFIKQWKLQFRIDQK